MKNFKLTSSHTVWKTKRNCDRVECTMCVCGRETVFYCNHRNSFRQRQFTNKCCRVCVASICASRQSVKFIKLNFHLLQMHLWRRFTHMAPTANPLQQQFQYCDATSVCAKAYRAFLSHEICSISQSVHVLLIEFIYPPVRNCFAYARTTTTDQFPFIYLFCRGEFCTLNSWQRTI